MNIANDGVYKPLLATMKRELETNKYVPWSLVAHKHDTRTRTIDREAPAIRKYLRDEIGKPIYPGSENLTEKGIVKYIGSMESRKLLLAGVLYKGTSLPTRAYFCSGSPNMDTLVSDWEHAQYDKLEGGGVAQEARISGFTHALPNAYVHRRLQSGQILTAQDGLMQRAHDDKPPDVPEELFVPMIAYWARTLGITLKDENTWSWNTKRCMLAKLWLDSKIEHRYSTLTYLEHLKSELDA